MEQLLERMGKALQHLYELHNSFKSEYTGKPPADIDATIFNENTDSLNKSIEATNALKYLYSQPKRQMILADLIEYIFFGRILINMDKIELKQEYIKLTLNFVNILMSYENMTVNTSLRNKYLDSLKNSIKEVAKEKYFKNLRRYSKDVGLPNQSKKLKKINKYFDRLLPKTAGGLWHEMLVFIFLLRQNYGHIIPLLLTQRFIGMHDNIIPPDYLIIGHDKRLYGIEVGTKKEIQSGTFSLQSAIPTATIDTSLSRSSDRCPICKRWIQFCPFVIEKYSDFSWDIPDDVVNCITDCTRYSRDEIVQGKCLYTKYSRSKIIRDKHTQHPYADGKHYHYKCVLDEVDLQMKNMITEAEDERALKTHYPYYSGLEALEDE